MGKPQINDRVRVKIIKNNYTQTGLIGQKGVIIGYNSDGRIRVEADNGEWTIWFDADELERIN
jgi:hypothetical protein